MIKRIVTKEDAKKCDQLLTLLVLDEKQYDDTINLNFKANNYYENVMEDNILLGYYIDDDIVGYVYVKKITAKGYLIDALYVMEDKRNLKIGTSLLKEAISLCGEYEFLDINVMYNNKKALSLYKKLGFNEFRLTLRMDKKC